MSHDAVNTYSMSIWTKENSLDLHPKRNVTVQNLFRWRWKESNKAFEALCYLLQLIIGISLIFQFIQVINTCMFVSLSLKYWMKKRGYYGHKNRFVEWCKSLWRALVNSWVFSDILQNCVQQKLHFSQKSGQCAKHS